MKFKKIISLILISISLVLNINTSIAYSNNIINIKKESRKEVIARLYKDIPMKQEHVFYLVNLSYQYNIDPDLILSIIWCESNFNPLAKNKKSSASGYSQMIKSTALNCVKNINGIKSYNHKIDAFDPYINLQLMVYYIDKCMYNTNDNIDRMLLSYRGCNDIKYFNTVKKRMNFIKESKKRNTR